MGEYTVWNPDLVLDCFFFGCFRILFFDFVFLFSSRQASAICRYIPSRKKLAGKNEKKIYLYLFMYKKIDI